MATRKIEDLHPILQEIYSYSVKEYLRLYPSDPQPFITCAYRDNQEQSELYAKGRTTGKLGKILTNAKAGQSPHNFLPSMAFDIAFKDNKNALDWNTKLFVKFWNIIQQRFPGKIAFGGNFSFRDFPHYELNGWKTIKSKK